MACVGLQRHRGIHFKIVFQLVLPVEYHVIVISKFQLWESLSFLKSNDFFFFLLQETFRVNDQLGALF